MNKKILILINSLAGKNKAEKYADRIKNIFENYGYQTDLFIPKTFQDFVNIAKNKAHDYTHIAACGGDGSLNAVVNACIDKNVTFVFIPAGTVNIFAKEFKIPFNPVKATEKLVKGKETYIDVIKAGDKYALLMISSGIDSFTIKRVKSQNKKPGKFQYAYETLKNAFKYDFPDIKIIANGKQHKAKFVIAGQTKKYAGLMNLLPSADFKNGLLNVCLFKGKSIASYLNLAVKSIFGFLKNSKNVNILQARELEIIGPETIMSQIDGDLHSPLPLKIKIIPQKLRFLVPGQTE